MPVYQLDDSLWFPGREEYEKDMDVVAVGGKVGAEQLHIAYKMGIFPWYNDAEPIYWWCPVERMILHPSEVKISKSSRKILEREIFTIKADTAFQDVIENCQKIKRKGQDGSWLNNDLKKSLMILHEKGIAHSIEAYYKGELAGGLYGLSIGRMFFGDSMFSFRSNASKTAFFSLAQKLEELDFQLIDCQVYTPHLESLGAHLIPRAEFLDMIEENQQYSTLQGNWKLLFE